MDVDEDEDDWEDDEEEVEDEAEEEDGNGDASNTTQPEEDDLDTSIIGGRSIRKRDGKKAT